MKAYEMKMDTRIYFGSGCTENAVKKEKSVIGERTLLITGRTLKKLGFAEILAGWMDAEAFLYDKVTADPDVAEIREAIRLGKKNRVNSVIGFGGGSAIDAAKAAAVGIASDIDIEAYLLQGLALPPETLPVIAIPTTSGTGAELSKGAIISSRAKGVKGGIRGESIVPAVAIVDPSYTYSLPMNVTMESGFDVFAHAAESYCAVKANPFSEMLSEKAVRIAGDALPRLAEDLDDQEAREKMSFASHIMGYNVRDVGNCLPHRLQYPVGAATGTSHGAGLIALYPSWVKYEYTVNPQKIDEVLSWLGCGNGTPEERLRSWFDKLGISRTVTDLGITLKADELAERVTGNLGNDRLADVPGIVTTLYGESM